MGVSAIDLCLLLFNLLNLKSLQGQVDHETRALSGFRNTNAKRRVF